MLRHLITQYAVLFHNIESRDRIVTTDYCDVTSPYVYLVIKALSLRITD